MDTATQARFNSAVKRLSLALFIVAFLALGVLIAFGLSQTQSSGADIELEPATDSPSPFTAAVLAISPFRSTLASPFS